MCSLCLRCPVRTPVVQRQFHHLPFCLHLQQQCRGLSGKGLNRDPSQPPRGHLGNVSASLMHKSFPFSPFFIPSRPPVWKKGTCFKNCSRSLSGVLQLSPLICSCALRAQTILKCKLRQFGPALPESKIKFLVP